MTPPIEHEVAFGSDVARFVAGSHHDPHQILGPHVDRKDLIVRCYHPDAVAASLVLPKQRVEMQKVNDAGLFEVRVADTDLGDYRLHFRGPYHEWEMDDPYRFLPTLGDLDLHLISEGRHKQLWRRLGARVIEHQGVKGTAFAVWAPNARGVHLVSDASGWDDRIYPMRSLGSSGVWELFLPNVAHGTKYKFRITQANGRVVLKSDPMARWTEAPPQTASIVEEPQHEWKDKKWLEQRAAMPLLQRPLSVYEVHLGSWRRDERGHTLGYRDLAAQLASYCTEMGYTHVELMPVAEHPFTASWGYQVSNYYAPTARYGTPEDFRFFVDHLHQSGIGVIVDWVPAHFPKDDWALARFDGTALYEHADPRRGEHPDWGTYVFNYGRNEVRNFLIANARYWCDEFHIDGLRVDAVASMLYLDYSRKPGEWLANVHGGNENLEAISFLREFNEVVHGDFPGALTFAEESTAWPGVSRPTTMGGLGFTYKWNMGWMHDTLEYISKDPVFRRYHHNQLTFGMWYAFNENFVLPLSHDEVVHLKRSLLEKMPGDRWQKFANLRALFGWMYAHPGKKLLFMGGEFGQNDEWSHDKSLDWHLLRYPEHAGMQQLLRDIGRIYRGTEALWQSDHETDGFYWIDGGNADQNVASFARVDKDGKTGLVCVANFSPNVYHHFRVGLPQAGEWKEVLNTDSGHYDGSGQGNLGVVRAENQSWNGQPASAEMTLPPLAVIWLAP